MIKHITFMTLTSLFLIGCGGTESVKGSGSAVDNTPKDYDLWAYMVPNTSNTNTFTLSSQNSTSTYKTNYKVSQSRVEEIADYAQDEKTVYTKEANKIVVSFEKNNKPNGIYELHLGANINDIVTMRTSGCKLTKHLDTFTINQKAFADVIEITCDGIPGYYQKGVGEVAQIEDSSGKNIRVLSN